MFMNSLPSKYKNKVNWKRTYYRNKVIMLVLTKVPTPEAAVRIVVPAIFATWIIFPFQSHRN